MLQVTRLFSYSVWAAVQLKRIESKRHPNKRPNRFWIGHLSLQSAPDRQPIPRDFGSLPLAWMLIALASGIAHGQQAPSQGAALQEPALQEVVVTAQLRSEGSQSVPVSLSALTGDAIQQNGLTNIADIGQLVPGVSVQRTGLGENNIVIEGVSYTPSTGGQSSTSTVGYYYGDVPLIEPDVDFPMYDLNRVEVLRGPQGTLYGSGSMGGTVKFVPNEPVFNQFSAKVGLDTDHIQHSEGLGNTAYAVVNIPIAEKLAARVLMFGEHEQGYIDRYLVDPNNYLGIDTNTPPDRGVNSYDYYGYQLQVKYEPWDNVTIVPLFLSVKEMSAGISTVDLPQDNLSAGQLLQTRDSPEPSTYDTNLANLPINATFGPVNVVSDTSYVKQTVIQTEDLSKTAYVLLGAPAGLPVVPLPIFNYLEPSELVQEVRASSTIGPVDATLGVYYNRTRYPYVQSFPFTPQWLAAYGNPVSYFGNSYPFYNTLFVGDLQTNHSERAIFTQETYRLTSKLSLTAGVRAIRYDVSGGATEYGALNGPETFFSAQHTYSGVTPKFNLAYQVTPDKMVYVTAAKGLRTGGIQAPAPVVCDSDLPPGVSPPTPTGFAPDSLWNYELGAKTKEFDGRWIVNGNAYYIDWSKIQEEVQLECGFPFVSNFGQAKIKGGTLEVQGAPVDPIKVYGSLSYTDAKLTNTVAGTTGQAGDPLLYTPMWSGAVSAEYRRELNSYMSGFVRVEGTYTDRIYRDFVPSFYQIAPSYYLLNLRLGVHTSEWDVTSYVKNLCNKITQSAERLSVSGSNLPDTRAVAVVQPRTVGVEIVRYFQ
jgi:iron complex outermembrane recepter protein